MSYVHLKRLRFLVGRPISQIYGQAKNCYVRARFIQISGRSILGSIGQLTPRPWMQSASPARRIGSQSEGSRAVLLNSRFITHQTFVAATASVILLSAPDRSQQAIVSYAAAHNRFEMSSVVVHRAK